MRGEYYKSLGDDVSRMIAYDVPGRQFYDLGVAGPGEVIDQAWRYDFEQKLLASFKDFDTTDFWPALTQLQLDGLF